MATFRRTSSNARQGALSSGADPAHDTRYHRLHAVVEREDGAPNVDNESVMPASSVGTAADSSTGNPPRKEAAQPVLKKHTKFSHAYGRITADYWTYELVALLVCVAALSSIVAILVTYQNGPTPHIMRGVSLNTAISILATISRAAIVFVAASVIAQQKWLRFENRACPIYEVSLYDDATRGPLGSLYLLLSFRLGFITVLATIAVVLALGLEPFVQQSVRYPLRDSPISSRAPTLPMMKNVVFQGQANSNLTAVLDPAVLQALYADSVEPLQPACAGTSCSWPSYTSAAFCSSCEDALDDVSFEPKQYQAFEIYTNIDFLSTLQYEDFDLDTRYISKSISTLYTISLGTGALVQFVVNSSADILVGTAAIFRELSFPQKIVWNLNDNSITDCYTAAEAPPYSQDQAINGCFPWMNRTINGIKGPMKAFGYVEMARSDDNLTLTVKEAQRCIVTLCAQEYSTTFHNGSLSSQVMDQSFGYYQINHDYMYDSFFAWYAHFKDTMFSCAAAMSSSNPILAQFWVALSRVEGTFTASYSSTGYGDETAVEESAATNNPSSDAMQFMADVRNGTARLAQGLTNFLQQQSADAQVTGQAYVSIPIVEVRWAWLAFPLALVGLGIATLVVTVVQTRGKRMAVWKASPFPLLLNYHDHDGCASGAGEGEKDVFEPKAVRTSKHEEIAKETQLRLRSNGGIWTFERKN